MKTLVKVGTVFGLVLLTCSWTLAQGGGRREVRHSEREQNNLREVLGLTESQVTAIRQEQQAREQRLHDIHVRIQQFDEQIYQAADESGDALTVGKLVLEKVALQKQVRAEDEAYEQRVNVILTPDQQARLAQIQEAASLVGGRDPLFSLEMGGGERREAPRRREGTRRPPEPIAVEK